MKNWLIDTVKLKIIKYLWHVELLFFNFICKNPFICLLLNVFLLRASLLQSEEQLFGPEASSQGESSFLGVWRSGASRFKVKSCRRRLTVASRWRLGLRLRLTSGYLYPCLWYSAEMILQFIRTQLCFFSSWVSSLNLKDPSAALMFCWLYFF